MPDKKADIYRCGKELFTQNGFKDTNIADITKMAGVATGTFYNYYPSKEKLFMEIYNEENLRLKKSIMEATDLAAEPIDVIQRILSLNMQGMLSNPILREWYNRDVFGKIEKDFREENGLENVYFLYSSFIEIVEDWQARGKMRKDIDSKMIMMIFAAIINVDTHKEEIGLEYFPELLTKMTELIMQGLTNCPEQARAVFSGGQLNEFNNVHSATRQSADSEEKERMGISEFYRSRSGDLRSCQDIETALQQPFFAEGSGFAMNTEITYKVFGCNAYEAVDRAVAEILRLEGLLSRFVPDSDISRLNRTAGKGAVRVSAETVEVLSCALRQSENSQGLFNVSAGPLIELWDYKHAADVPDSVRIRQALSLVDYHDLVLNIQEKTAELRMPGQSVDLGGIGKGFAGDRFIEILRRNGIDSSYVNLGGNVCTLGKKPDGSPWRVGIRHPRESGGLLGAVAVDGKSVVTSGDYERYFIDREGKRRHHILNPLTGCPAESGLISVTVIADSAMLADALSTAVFVAGIKKGAAFLAQYPEADAVLMDNDLQVYITEGLYDRFQGAEGIEVNIFGKEQH